MTSWERARRKSISNREFLIAVSHNKFDDVSRLINEDVDINFKDQDGCSALSLAAEFADSKITQLLIDKGAILDYKNNDQETPLDISKRLNRSDIVEIFERAINKNDLDVAQIPIVTTNSHETTKNVIGNGANDLWNNFIYNNIYRLKVLMLLLNRGLICKYSFRLDVGESKTEKLESLIFTYTTNNKKTYRLLLAKHKVDETEKITLDKLFSEVEGDYNLIKYFRSYQARKKDFLKDGIIEDITICTNINFDFDSLEKSNIALQRVEVKDDVVNIKSIINLPTRYKFTDSSITKLSMLIKNGKYKKNNINCQDEKEFLGLLSFVVNQPNEEEVGKIIKREIGKEFDLITTENMYNKFLTRIVDWTKGKKAFASYNDAEDLFDHLRKNMLIWYNVQDPVKSFTGRKKQLENMHRLLQDEGDSLTCISGLSGVGKSELVKKYIAEYSECYDNKIIWFNAESYHTLVNSFHKLASEKLGIGIVNVDGKEKDMNLLVSEIYQHFSKSKSLFIFDNCEAYRSESDFDSGIDKFLPNLPDNCHKPRIIITSRKKEWPDKAKLLFLEAFDEEEAIEFICRTFELANDCDAKQAIDLEKALQLFPLALELAVAHISAQNNQSQAVGTTFKIDDYTKKIANGSKECLNFDVSSPNGSDSSCTHIVQLTYNVTLEALKQEENFNDCLMILNLVSYFLADNIPVKTLLTFLHDREKLALAIEVLEKYSLVRLYHKVLSVHRSVQQATRIRLQKTKEEKKILEKMLKLIDSVHINCKNVDHFMSVWSYSKRYTDLVETYHYVFSLITGELTSCGRIEEAHSMGIEIVELLNPLSDSSNVQSGLMNMKSRLGDILLRQGKYEAALREFEELYETEIGLKGSADNKSLDTKSDIALALQKLGKTDEALRCYREILEIRRVTLGESHVETLSIKSHMATVLMEQEKYDEALPIFEQVYNAQKATLGDNHYDTLMTRNSMAALFLFQRKHEEALKIFEDIYNARDEMLFENHPALLIARQNIATTLQRQQKFDLALEIYEEVYKIQKELLGEDHPEVLAIRGEIALMLHMLGKPDEALTILQEVLEKQSEVLGLYHPLVLRTQFLVAHNLEEQCRYTEAVPIYQELLKLGMSATGVASMPLKLHNSLGSIFMLQGNVDKALKHYEQVLKITENTYGPSHRKSLIAKSNVGSLYYKKKDYPKALSVLSEVHHVEEMVYGKDHDTYHSTHHFINKILFEKQLHENQLRSVAQSPTDDPLLAIEHGDLSLLKKLIKRGANVNARDANKKTLLHHATRADRLEIVKFLLKRGADVTCLSEKGKTALHVAVSQNHLEICDELLRNVNYEQSKALIDAKTTVTGSTALHVASKSGFYEITRLLLSRGATYDAKNHDAKEPLGLAKNSLVASLLNDIRVLFELVRSGKSECQDKLQECSILEYLAATNARDHRGHNLMQFAIVNNHRETVKLLGQLAVEKSRNICSLPYFNNVNLDDILPVVTCASTRLRDETCVTKTALRHVRKLIAAFRSQDKRMLDRNIVMIEDILRLLKSRKEDENLADVARIAVDCYVKIFQASIYSAKLLDAAKRNDWVSLEKCLTECANVNVTDEGGWTPLLHAANAGNEKMLRLLLDNGAFVNCATTTAKNTSLHIAVNKAHLNIVKLLLGRDATSEFVNAKTEAKGSTALHIAAKIGCFDTIMLLLRNGAIYCLPNKDGELPIDLATDQSVRAFFELLDQLFYDVKNGRAQIIRKLKALQPEQFLSVISACNEEEFTLANVAAAREHTELANKILHMCQL